MEQEFRIVIGGQNEDLGSRLRNLSNIPKEKDSKASNSTNEEESDTVIILGKKNKGEKKEKKGKKKKKKKNKPSLELMVDGEYIGTSDSDDENDIVETEESQSGSGFIDAEEMLYGLDDEDDDLSGDIIDEQRRGYKKLKKDGDDFKKEFADEIGLLYDLLKEMNKFVSDNEKKLRSMESSKARGISKYLIDMIVAVQTGKQSKLNIIKEIINVRKIIADLKIKSEAKNKDAGKNSAEHISSLYYQKIIGSGRANAVNALLGMNGGNDPDGEYDDTEYLPDNIASVIEDFEASRGIANDSVHSRIEEKLRSGNPYRSEEGNAYIEYEQDEVQVRIKRYIESNEWEFIALDKNNQVVYDYPLPDKSAVGKVRFSQDGTYATDGRGISYKIIDVI